MNVRRALPWIGFFVVAGGLLAWAYAPAITGPFLWDDHNLIERDARVTGHAPFSAFFAPFWGDDSWSDARTAYFRPLVNLSYAWNLRLSPTAESFHLTNLTVHLLSIFLLALLAKRDGANRATAWILALAWGLLPRSTEAVAWIAGRTDALATMFGLGAMLLWPAVDEASWRGELRRAGVAFLIALALLSKEVALAVPIALVAADLAADRKRAWSSIRWPAAMAIAYGALRFFALKNAPAPHDGAHASPLLTPLEALGHYVQMILDPWQPRVPIGMRGEIDPAFVALGAAAVLAALALGFAGWRRAKKRGAPWAAADAGTVRWTVLALAAIAPVLQIVPIRLGGGVVADRFLYLPLAALTVLAARALAPFVTTIATNGARRSRAIPAIALGAAALIASELVATRARAAMFGDELTLWLTIGAEANPHNTIALTNLAALPALSERPDLKLQLDKHVSEVLETTGRHGTPTYRRARSNEMTALAEVGRYDEAVAIGETLAREFPDNAVVAAELGYAELHAETFGAARDAFARAVVLDPKFADARRMLDVTRSLAARGAEFSRSVPKEDGFRLRSTIGQRIEASRLAQATALDTTLPDPPRVDALHFAMLFADVRAARTTLTEAAVTLEAPDPPMLAAMDALLKSREARRAEVDRAAERIARLATQPE